MSVVRGCFGVRLCAVFLMAVAVFTVAQAPVASARNVNGCEIVDNPTHGHHTNCPGAELHRADLRGTDLEFANLSGADLSAADLDSSNLNEAILHRAVLSRAGLDHARLTNADLPEAVLVHAEARHADLAGANLSAADASFAHLDRANLSGANLRSADVHAATLIFANLQAANLFEADLRGANLRYVTFDASTNFCRTFMPDGSINDNGCHLLGAKPSVSRGRTFVLAAATTRTFDVGYPSALKYARARHFCDAWVLGPGKRYVKILSHRSARGGTVCDVRARDNAKLPGLDTTAKIMVTATTVGLAAVAAPTAPPAGRQYLFSISTSSGSLIGPSDKHLTLRLSGARNYLTRFADRPLGEAFVVANVDFAKRFQGYFASSKPNAVLTYTPHGSRIPVSIELTIGQPRWNAERSTWTFPATRIRKRPGNLLGTTVHVKSPSVANPRSFTSATLLISEPQPSGLGAGGFSGGFLAGSTPVELADGSSIPIDEVTVGDRVMSTDLSGNQVPATIWWAAGTDDGVQPAMVYIELEDGTDLIAGMDTGFTTREGAGVRAAHLQPGDTIRTVSGPEAIARVTLGSYHGDVAMLGVTGPTGTFLADGVLVEGETQ